jgi:hypothetical protein
MLVVGTLDTMGIKKNIEMDSLAKMYWSEQSAHPAPTNLILIGE